MCHPGSAGRRHDRRTRRPSLTGPHVECGRLASMWWQGVLAIVAGLLVVYAALLLLLWRYARRHPETVNLRDALRLLPDLLRLLRRLAGDRSLPPGVRVRLVLLLAYLASPIDLVP